MVTNHPLIIIPTAFIYRGYKGYNWLRVVTRVTNLSYRHLNFQNQGYKGYEGYRPFDQYRLPTSFQNQGYEGYRPFDQYRQLLQVRVTKVTIGYKWLHGLQNFFQLYPHLSKIKVTTVTRVTNPLNTKSFYIQGLQGLRLVTRVTELSLAIPTSFQNQGYEG